MKVNDYYVNITNQNGEFIHIEVSRTRNGIGEWSISPPFIPVRETVIFYPVCV